MSNNSGTVTPSVAPISGQLLGDLRVCRISVSSGATVTTPAGWTLVPGSPFTIASTRNLYVFQRIGIAFASEPTSNFVPSAGVPYGLVSFNLRTVRSDGLYADGAQGPTVSSNATGSTTLVAPSITPLWVPALNVISYHLLVVNSGVTFTTPSGMTAVTNVSGTGTTGHAVGLFSEVSQGGASGTRTSTTNQSGPVGACSGAFAPVIMPGLTLPPARRIRASCY